MIEASVRKRLGDFVLSASLRDEGFVCLAGRNGSGKSSLLRILAGLMEPDEGHVKVNGVDVTRVQVERRGVVLVTPNSFLPSMRVAEHLVFGAKIRGSTADPALVSRVKHELGVTFTGRVRDLSLGMRERVALATAVLSSPNLILVDEAFANLDNRAEFVRLYRGLGKSLSIDVVFATQSDVGADQADHMYNMVDGSLTKVF